MSPAEPSWDLYGAFLAVMRTGSLSAAARALDVAQPTVRRQIEQLESQLGVVLFTRAPNGLVPTELALATLPYAESIAASARALVRAVSSPTEADRGTVRVTCSEVVGAEVLPPMLAALRVAHPRLQIELVATNRTEDLLRRDADVAVRMAEPTQAGLVRRCAGRVELGLFATRAYLAAHAAPTSLAGLVPDHALVGADGSRAIIDALAAAGLVTTPRDYAFRSDSDVAKLAAVRAGLGIGVCQLPLSRRPVPLVRVLPALAFHLDVWVVMHEDLRAVRRVRLVFELLVAQLGAYATQARATRPAAKARPPGTRGSRSPKGSPTSAPKQAG
ncbi:LysR family transcriptional regulator [Sorangium sp. So ce1335]|uniref:LysR family transcriptional regulator n=1 Tax=Sorangium sp. So ce1335 TaxID=3133335 RepID=UPI003F5F0A90